MKTTAVVESLSYFKTNVLFQRIPTFFKVCVFVCELNSDKDEDEDKQMSRPPNTTSPKDQFRLAYFVCEHNSDGETEGDIWSRPPKCHP